MSMDIYFLEENVVQVDMGFSFGIFSKTFTMYEGTYTVDSGDISGDSEVTTVFKKEADMDSWTENIRGIVGANESGLRNNVEQWRLKP